jgi:hypothetical protein
VNALQQLIENISQCVLHSGEEFTHITNSGIRAMFWHVDDAAFKIDKTLSEGPEHIEVIARRVQEGKLPEADLDLLLESLRRM